MGPPLPQLMNYERKYMVKNVFEVLFKIEVFKILFKEMFEGYFMHFMGVGDSTTGESKIQHFSYCRQISLKSLKTSEDQLQNPRNP